MKKSQQISSDFWISIDGNKVISIQSFGSGDDEYDYFHTNEFENEQNAIDMFKRLGGVL